MILLRADARPSHGLGHARRSLTLATALRRMGQPAYVVTEAPADVFPGEGRLLRAPGPPGSGPLQLGPWLERWRPAAVVVDGNHVTSATLAALGRRVPLVIRIHDGFGAWAPSTMVVNGSGSARRTAYRGVPDSRLCLGPRFVLLRPGFTRARTGEPRHRTLFFSVGGTNPRPAWLFTLLEACDRRLDPGVRFVVMLGPLFSDSADLLPGTRRRMDVHRRVSDPSGLMLRATAGLVAAGQTLYELCALGVPTLAYALVPNQVAHAQALDRMGALRYLGAVRSAATADRFAQAAAALLGDGPGRRALGRRARRVVDGRGAERVARRIHAVVGTRGDWP